MKIIHCTVECIVPLEQNITIDHKMDLAISLLTTTYIWSAVGVVTGKIRMVLDTLYSSY